MMLLKYDVSKMDAIDDGHASKLIILMRGFVHEFLFMRNQWYTGELLARQRFRIHYLIGLFALRTGGGRERQSISINNVAIIELNQVTISAY